MGRAITSNYLPEETCDKIRKLLDSIPAAWGWVGLPKDQAKHRELFEIIDEGITVLCDECEEREPSEREPTATEEARHYGEHRG